MKQSSHALLYSTERNRWGATHEKQTKMHMMYKRFSLRLRSDGQESYQIKEQQNNMYDACLSLFSSKARRHSHTHTEEEEEAGTQTREAGVWVRGITRLQPH